MNPNEFITKATGFSFMLRNKRWNEDEEMKLEGALTLQKTLCCASYEIN